MTPPLEYCESPFYSQHMLPSLPAIYEVWARGLCLYVGQAKNLLKRWKMGHHAAVACAGAGAEVIRWRHVSPEQLDEMEAETIERLAPRLNKIRACVRSIVPAGCITIEQFQYIVNIYPHPDAYRLCSAIMASANYGGLVNKPNDDYAKELEIDKSRVSRLIGKLHDAGVIHRIGPRSIFINPAYLFRGTAKAQNEAVKQWSELRRPKLVDFQRKSA